MSVEPRLAHEGEGVPRSVEPRGAHEVGGAPSTLMTASGTSWSRVQEASEEVTRVEDAPPYLVGPT